MNVNIIQHNGMYLTKITPITSPDLCKKILTGAKSLNILRIFDSHNLLSYKQIDNNVARKKAVEKIKRIAELDKGDTFIRVNEK